MNTAAPGWIGLTWAAVPLAVAIGGFGLSFGVLARGAHLGWAAPVVMSLTTFAGSAQFAALLKV